MKVECVIPNDSHVLSDCHLTTLYFDILFQLLFRVQSCVEMPNGYHLPSVQGWKKRGRRVRPRAIAGLYRVRQVVVHLASVDKNLGSSPGWWAATVATYCPSRLGELPKFLSTEPRCTTTCLTLYNDKRWFFMV